MSTPAQDAANRANAAHSTGPVTTEGKAKSSKNAVTTALTGRTVLLPNDDPKVYQDHLQGYLRQFRPITPYEESLTQILADIDWRLQRIPHLLFALEAKGRREFAEAFEDQDPAEREFSIEIETRLKYEKQFRNLELQESRLQRQHDKAVAELEAVVKARDIRRKKDLETAAILYQAAEHDGEPFDAADRGFDFSNDDVRAFLRGARAAQIARDAVRQPTTQVLQPSRR